MLSYRVIRPVSTSHCTRFAPKLASIQKRKSGAWHVQVRRKGRSVSETYRARRVLAGAGGDEQERDHEKQARDG